MDPYLIGRLISEYDLPTGPGRIDMYWRMPSIPSKIAQGNNEEKSDFLRGIADVCGTLEGITPRGHDARIKFDIRNNVADESRYKSTVLKTVNFCNFLQEKMGIPIAGNYISLRSNARPHKLKIWIRDLADNFEMPLWRMKTHYQQRFNVALSKLKMPKSKFCCSPNDKTSNSIRGLQKWLQKNREIEPSLTRCINYCPRLQSALNRTTLGSPSSLIKHVSKAFKKSRGEEIP
jgi:hypothetical protein